MKKGSPDQKPRRRTCAEACHDPFNWLIKVVKLYRELFKVSFWKALIKFDSNREIFELYIFPPD